MSFQVFLFRFPMETKQRFRLATINVHSFLTPSTYADNSRPLAQLLRPLDLDLLAANEVPDYPSWTKFCDLLSLPHRVFGIAENRFLGNGIASRYPIESSSNDRSTGMFRAEGRSLLQCRLGGEHPFVRDRTFAVTHLDHRDEDVRLHQLKLFNPVAKNIDVLMGDMNALTREDYSDDFYQTKIVDVRQRSSWEPARFDLTDLLTKDWMFRDAFREMHRDLRDDQVSTCRFASRIDYIYLRQRREDEDDDRWVLTECDILPANEATDHNAIVAQFEDM